MALTPSNKLEDRYWGIIYSPPGGGKTSLAPTASEHCPLVLPAKELTEIPDVAIWQYDIRGARALTDLNLVCAVEDLSGPKNLDALLSLEAKAHKEVSQAAVDGKIKYLFIDTLSARDDLICGQFAKEENTMAMYGNIKMAHVAFMNTLLRFPVCLKVIFLMHAKDVIKAESKKDMVANKIMRAKAASTQATTFDVAPALTGAGINGYVGRSNVWWLKKVARKGQPVVRTLVTHSSSKFQVKSREENMLDAEEPANLAAIFKKINV